jgi:hypothetical protein
MSHMLKTVNPLAAAQLGTFDYGQEPPAQPEPPPIQVVRPVEPPVPESWLVGYRIPKHRPIGGAGRFVIPAIVTKTYIDKPGVYDLLLIFDANDQRVQQRADALDPANPDAGGWFVQAGNAEMSAAMELLRGEYVELHKAVTDLRSEVAMLAKAANTGKGKRGK